MLSFSVLLSSTVEDCSLAAGNGDFSSAEPVIASVGVSSFLVESLSALLSFFLTAPPPSNSGRSASSSSDWTTHTVKFNNR